MKTAWDIANSAIRWEPGQGHLPKRAALEVAIKKYAREAIAEHLEMEITDDEINTAAMIDSVGRDIQFPGRIWKRAISWYKSKLDEET
jgi:hypothetical protein